MVYEIKSILTDAKIHENNWQLTFNFRNIEGTNALVNLFLAPDKISYLLKKHSCMDLKVTDVNIDLNSPEGTIVLDGGSMISTDNLTACSLAGHTAASSYRELLSLRFEKTKLEQSLEIIRETLMSKTIFIRIDGVLEKKAVRETFLKKKIDIIIHD